MKTDDPFCLKKLQNRGIYIDFYPEKWYALNDKEIPNFPKNIPNFTNLGIA